ncbi:hypothetical protein ABT324_22580 [Saccharopolyspora sp. NPDC000359]|uniref:hypothetical protein n=1 Tax=Saccharopolyspora sp. NPDC000359 TaxID=3154251 RepID=UPI003321770E
MSTSAQHPLESLYRARDELQSAVHQVQHQPPEQVSDDLGCYATVNTSILHEFRALVTALAEQTQGADRQEVRAAHRGLRGVIPLFDQIAAYVELHQSTTEALRSPAPADRGTAASA